MLETVDAPTPGTEAPKPPKPDRNFPCPVVPASNLTLSDQLRLRLSRLHEDPLDFAHRLRWPAHSMRRFVAGGEYLTTGMLDKIGKELRLDIKRRSLPSKSSPTHASIEGFRQMRRACLEASNMLMGIRTDPTAKKAFDLLRAALANQPSVG